MSQVIDIDTEKEGRIDGVAFRQAMGAFATGVAVVTASSNDDWFGMTMNSLTSVSLDPCLLLICPRRGSATGNAIRNSGHFAVSLLAHDQQDLATRFVGRNGNMADRFNGLDISVSKRGLPLLANALSSFECRLYDIHDGGDHDVVIGEVVSCRLNGGDPLVFYCGSFGNFAEVA